RTRTRPSVRARTSRATRRVRRRSRCSRTARSCSCSSATRSRDVRRERSPRTSWARSTSTAARRRRLPSTLRERAPAFLALGGALVLAYLAVRPELYVSWTPPDEGVLAQGAERVMRGELPHRDFVALWSGGLDYLNAAAFRVLGPRLATLRTVVAAAWLLGLAAMFAAARHLLSAWVAGALTLCPALWTLPLSPHPLPSWYNLFLALFGVAAMLQWMRRRQRIWLVAAGAAAGASVAVKIIGLYFVAPGLLFFVL